jgi:hypothetical protein
VYCNGRMKSHSRQLRQKPPSIGERAKRHITLSGLKPRDMVRWANLNLIDWLNHSRSGSVRRVLEIIDLAQTGYELHEERRQASTDEQSRSCFGRIMKVLSKLNTILLRYECTARIVSYGSSLSRQYLFLSRRGRDPEVIAVAFLIENLAVVHRVRRCAECQRWFFGITEHQKYCGDNCRKRHAARGEEFLEKRRTYMRDYRQKQKAADMRAKKLAEAE